MAQQITINPYSNVGLKITAGLNSVGTAHPPPSAGQKSVAVAISGDIEDYSPSTINYQIDVYQS